MWGSRVVSLPVVLQMNDGTDAAAYVGGSAEESRASSSGGSSRRRKVCCGWVWVKGIGGCEGSWVEGRSAGGRGGEEENIVAVRVGVWVL